MIIQRVFYSVLASSLCLRFPYFPERSELHSCVLVILYPLLKLYSRVLFRGASGTFVLPPPPQSELHSCVLVMEGRLGGLAWTDRDGGLAWTDRDGGLAWRAGLEGWLGGTEVEVEGWVTGDGACDNFSIIIAWLF